jgi:hypothetical protein
VSDGPLARLREWLAGPRRALLVVCVAAVTSVAGAQAIGDPTRPTSLSEPVAQQAAVAVQGPRWRLQSTLVADSRRLAVINGRTVAQGARVEGARLLEVRPDGVTLEEDGQRIDLRLPGTQDPKRASAAEANEGVPGNE